MSHLTVIHLDYFPSQACPLKDMCYEELLEFFKRPKVSMLACSLLQRLSLLSDFKINKHPFRRFHGRALNDVHLQRTFLQVGNGLCHNKTLFP